MQAMLIGYTHTCSLYGNSQVAAAAPDRMQQMSALLCWHLSAQSRLTVNAHEYICMANKLEKGIQYR